VQAVDAMNKTETGCKV